MKYLDGTGGSLPTLELTRRNLRSLLAKLDGNPPDSACTLISPDYRIVVKAVEDAAHYAERQPGRMHEATEAAIHGG
jgi:hypothetical protein